MHAGCETRMALVADGCIGCGVVRVWRSRGSNDRCQHNRERSIKYYDGGEPYGRVVAHPGDPSAGSIRNARLEIDEYHRVHGCRCLERIGGNDRFEIDGTAQGNG
jgi:hypothetical protein